MTGDVPRYSTIVVFGKELSQSVASPDVFRSITNSLAAFINVEGYPLACRGYVVNPQGRNVAPRRAAFNARTMDKWVKALTDGTFMSFEIFDTAWSDDHFPVTYAHLHKLWDYRPTGYEERTKSGAENRITVAVQEHLVSNRTASLKAYARTIVDMLSSFYGFIETNVPWDREVGQGVREDMIDIRWANRGERDYKGLFKMDTMIPRLYRENILASEQIKDGSPASLPSWAVSRVEAWRDDLFYVQFIRDPQEDALLRDQLEPYFNLGPCLNARVGDE